MMARLKLRGMHAVFDEVLTNGRKARWATERIMMELLRAEAAERHLRSIRYEEWLEEAKRKKLEKKLNDKIDDKDDGYIEFYVNQSNL